MVEGLGGYKKRGWGSPWTMLTREGRVRALFPKALPYWKRVFHLSSARVGEPSFKHESLMTVTEPSTCPLPYVTADWPGRGTRQAIFARSLPSRAQRRQLKTRQGRSCPCSGLSKRPGQQSLLRKGSKAGQEGLTTPVLPVFHRQWLCLCLVSDSAELTIVSGYDSLPQGWRILTCHDVSNHPCHSHTQEVWQVIVGLLSRNNHGREGVSTAIPTAGIISITTFAWNRGTPCTPNVCILLLC